ncbi:MAG: FKBP-type peptidyl-prolyl cis-trans isomerase [Bacteroidales bacterium]|nr:FKBP-type peptidyl-prolyl cis-trans isomerase [Candidatus Cryptobacteroides faecihippi]
MDKLSYALGMSIASSLAQSGVTELNVEDFGAAIKASLAGEMPALDFEEAGQLLDNFFKEMQEKQAAEAANLGEARKKEGEEFLAENAKKEGVVVLPSGLQYKVVKEGSDRMAGKTDTVRCHYEGRFINGQIFDSSYKRGVPAEFGVNQVIKGWTEALQLMGEGAEWELYIPYNLAYGEAGAHGSIPPYSALIFKVEVIKVL